MKVRTKMLLWIKLENKFQVHPIFAWREVFTFAVDLRSVSVTMISLFACSEQGFDYQDSNIGARNS